MSSDLSRLRIDRGALSARPRRRWKVLAALVVIAGIVVFAWLRHSTPAAVETASVVRAWPSQNYTVLNATGYVVPQRKAALSTKASGRLEWLGVLEGSRVKAGDIIARLESRDVRASLDQAAAQVNVAEANLQQGQAELKDAEANFKRSQELLEKKFISGAQHDADTARLAKARALIASQKAAVVSAEANRRAAEVAVEQTQIRVPFDGVVLTKNANVGDNITPFSAAADSKGAVVTVADMQTLEVEADVAEASVGRIKVDQPVEIQLDALPGIRLAGLVSRMVPTVDRSKATVLVKARFSAPDPRVLPDMSAKVAFLEKAVPEADREPVSAVQASAIAERDGKKVLFVLKDNQAHARPVQTGRKIGELTEIRGVEAGERVVLNPPDNLREGARVTAAKK